MKVKELLRQLEGYDPESEVIIHRGNCKPHLNGTTDEQYPLHKTSDKTQIVGDHSACSGLPCGYVFLVSKTEDYCNFCMEEKTNNPPSRDTSYWVCSKCKGK